VKNSELRIVVNATSHAEANRLTAELESWLNSRVDGIKLVRKKENEETQDAGTVLLAVLSAPAVIEFAKGPALELAKGVADWLRKRRTTVTIGADGSVNAENVDADTAERIIMNALYRQTKDGSA